ncbi:zinc ribbon domain-containing protein [candidate division WOR-3 bacterium]|nr:zinc ribbon domain-containing protein [candidate division WOR-3 bacterium]
MPIREFCCNGCGVVFEALVFSADDEAAEQCPACGSTDHSRLYSVFGVAGTDKKLLSSGSCGSCASHSCSTCGSGG